jgi:hypothetical protein
MVILMTGQRGSTREGLLTVGIWALVRALAGVNPTMASERAGITEGLRRSQSCLQMHCEEEEEERTFPQRSHICGFSPVWTRW